MNLEVTDRRMPEPCVGAVLVWNGALLLIKRGQEPGIGQWSLPGGRLEPLEAWQEAVEREVEEEPGLGDGRRPGHRSHAPPDAAAQVRVGRGRRSDWPKSELW